MKVIGMMKTKMKMKLKSKNKQLNKVQIPEETEIIQSKNSLKLLQTMLEI